MTKKKTPARPKPKKYTPPDINGIQKTEPPAEKTQAWERGKAFKTSPHIWEDPQGKTE